LAKEAITMNNYLKFWGFKSEPFPTDLPAEHIFKSRNLAAFDQRFEYVLRLGAVGLVTGEIGAGKSTALRYAVDKLHPSQFKPFYVTAASGSVLEFYRLILSEMGFEVQSNSRAAMLGLIKREILDLALAKNIKPVLIVDEASLMRLEAFAEIHTIIQFEKDSKPYLPLILAGQSNLIDKLTFRDSQPLASRVAARSHFEGADLEEMTVYLKHHLTAAGLKDDIFEPEAAAAIQQGSGGVFRKANHLARGALMAAAEQKVKSITADHVRLAATEIF